jgi:ribA/ribD-fused uncharacterized protein
MSTILFSSHLEIKYKNEPWRHIFSQWYCSGKTFIGKDAIYDLTEIINEDDWTIYVIDINFSLREQWMMYLKSLIFAKNEHRNINLIIGKKILSTNNLGVIKKLGKNIKGFNQDIWDKYKFKILVNGNYLEFTQNKEMKKILLNTNNREIVDASSIDNIWDTGLSENDAINTPKSKWGENLLGKAIMEVRQHL